MLSPRAWAPRTASFSENRPSDWIRESSWPLASNSSRPAETKQDALLDLAVDPLVIYEEQISAGTVGPAYEANCGAGASACQRARHSESFLAWLTRPPCSGNLSHNLPYHHTDPAHAATHGATIHAL
jgi:hypothetical protein